MNLDKINNFAVFGLSFGGRQFVRKCIEYNYKIDGIIDNDIKKNGNKFCGVPIFLPEKLSNTSIKNIFLIGRYIKEQEKQLLNLGFCKNNIFHIPRKEISLKGKSLVNRSKLTISFLNTISKVCNSINLEIWLDASGLLTVARNQDLGTLSDFDLLITGKQKISTLTNELVKARSDWMITKYKNSDNLDEFALTLMNSKLEEKVEPAVVDMRGFKLNPWFKEDPNLYKNYFKNSQKYFENTKIKYPYKYKEYLAKLYGSNWNIQKDFYEPSYFK